MDIRLIAMDLDGTALQKDRCYFSPRLQTALEQAHVQGVRILPVTGRQFGLLPPAFEEKRSWMDLAVVINGAQIRDLNTGAASYRLDIEPQALRQLRSLAEEFHLPIEFSIDSTLHLTQASFDLQLPWSDLTFHRNTILAHHGKIVPSIAPLCDRRIEKVNLLCVPEELRHNVVARLREISVSAVWSSASCMEITHPNATKGQTLAIVCRQLGIPMESVMALGDSGNDISMLQQAGLGVAMGNAPDFVKQAADVCTDSHDADGAAKAIEQYVLFQKGG